jgi:hypothetical protein
MSMIIDGTNGLTFNNATTQASAGNVLQVVQGTATSFSTTSTSFVNTGLTASITPKFSTSKILVQMTANVCIVPAVAGEAISFNMVRGGTSILSAANHLFSSSSTADRRATASLSYLDSPATTSSTTYTIQTSSRLGNSVTFADGGTSTIILMEIAG